MRELQGLSYTELASALDVSVPAVKSLLLRARSGLIDAATAREAPCIEIRDELLAASDRSVRISGRARRHCSECARCEVYRVELRRVRSDLKALVPGGPLAHLGDAPRARGWRERRRRRGRRGGRRRRGGGQRDRCEDRRRRVLRRAARGRRPRHRSPGSQPRPSDGASAPLAHAASVAAPAPEPARAAAPAVGRMRRRRRRIAFAGPGYAPQRHRRGRPARAAHAPGPVARAGRRRPARAGRAARPGGGASGASGTTGTTGATGTVDGGTAAGGDGAQDPTGSERIDGRHRRDRREHDGRGRERNDRPHRRERRAGRGPPRRAADARRVRAPGGAPRRPACRALRRASPRRPLEAPPGPRARPDRAAPRGRAGLHAALRAPGARAPGGARGTVERGGGIGDQRPVAGGDQLEVERAKAGERRHVGDHRPGLGETITLPEPSTRSPEKQTRPSRKAAWSGAWPGVAIVMSGPTVSPSARASRRPRPARPAARRCARG